MGSLFGGLSFVTGKAAVKIPVVPLGQASGGAKTVKLILTLGDNYYVGTDGKATVTIGGQ